MAEISLRVGGKRYAGWKSVRVMRGIECVSGSFDLSVSDRWQADSAPWPIRKGDECELFIGAETLITGYVDAREPAYGPEEHSLSVAGRDRTGDLVDCSALLKTWEFLNVPVLTLAKRVAEPFGISVTLSPGLQVPPPLAKVTADPGDTAFEVIERACRMAGLLAVADGRGGLLLTRPGRGRAATELVEGQNILAASSREDASGRYARYVVMGQHAGADETFGESAARVQATARDAGERRTARVLVIRPEGNVTPAHAKRRAEWEATVRAARGDTVTVTVQGWTQADGSVWPVNALVRVRSPRIDVDGDLLICQAVYGADEGGTTTQLTLRRPDAFQPEPVVPKRDKASLSGLLGGA